MFLIHMGASNMIKNNGRPAGMNVTNSMLYRLIDELNLNTIAISNITILLEKFIDESKIRNEK
jgi:hypothetical protein